MTTAGRCLAGILAALICLAGPLPAQTSDEQGGVVPSSAPALSPLVALFPDYDAWLQLADRAETVSANRSASDFALNRLREELAGWRDLFLDQQAQNAGRLATIDNQIAALGTMPEGEELPPAVAARLADLKAQRAELAAPDLLLAEAYAQADGLLAELDAIFRAQQREALLARGPSPINPAYWGEGLAALNTSFQAIVGDTSSGLAATGQTGSLQQNLPLAGLLMVVGVVLLRRGRLWVAALERRLTVASARWRAITAFVLSLGQIILPMIGLWALTFGLQRLNIASARADQLLSAFWVAGSAVIVARWLNIKLFPPGDNIGPLGYDPRTRTRIRRAGITLSYGLAVVVMVSAMLRTVDAPAAAFAVVLLPLQVLLGWFLFRLGVLISTPPADDQRLAGSGGQVRKLVGRLCMLAAVGTPILAALGYAEAALRLFQPVVLTIAILGVVIILQRLVFDIYAPRDSADAGEAGPLLPVLIGFLLFVLALPFLALAWGARVADLTELWSTVRAGLAIGNTRISPGDFLTFLLIFLGGYLLTRFLQSTLRRSVLPRTRLDLGGQNAIVAFAGYIGILLAALIAVSTAGIDLSNLAFVAGALSLGIGFGLQNIVQNFVSGIILLIERPIGEGDMIEVGGQIGVVRDISVRSTRIETFDRRDVIIPNADLVSGQVTNWTRGNAVGRLVLQIGVAYGSDVEKVRDILSQIAEDHPMVLADPAPQVFFMAFGASSLDFEVRVILRDVAWIVVTQSELNFEINRRFAEEGIEIPFPQQDVWLRNPEALRRPPAEGDPTS